MKSLFVIISVFIITSCASFNAAMTPSVKVMKDDFDNSTIIYQAPVSSASSMSESFSTLGFEWSSNTPNNVYLIAGVRGIENISGVAFNIDGEVLENIKIASSLTKYDTWSTRRFVISKANFIRLTKASSVKMKVSQIDTYTVSSFGLGSLAVVSSKFEPFLALVARYE
jgi:hypothetical protein